MAWSVNSTVEKNAEAVLFCRPTARPRVVHVRLFTVEGHGWRHALYHTWVWNRGICMCVIVRPRSHMLIVLKKVIPDTKDMTLLECNYLVFTNLSVCYFHSFCYNFKTSEKKLHLFTLFSITRHCFSLFLVGSKSMLAILPFKSTITPRHLNDKCFHRADGDLICRFCIFAHHISNV